MTTIFNLQTWKEIAERGTSGDQVSDILESWQLDRDMFQIIIDDLKQQLNIEWMKGYKDGMLAMKVINEISKND